ncbi:hypothetical protein EG68_07606 [Paragonimus skrjabini miyazakii]|uniref:UBA domain-containing protein n=1 Tax=Paragonimus skrjabini miyazakii TaxID=59628 RepID=A0A8S9YVT9_9TREM|nr:hypothetical protein EG68_07606 [Paragonimus skrjabini miyazakii]
MHLFKLITPCTKVEITRWNVPENELSLWDMLINKLERMLGMPFEKLHLSWFDGRDFCAIHGPVDLRDAMEFMQNQPDTDGCSRIFVSRDETAHSLIFSSVLNENGSFRNEHDIPLRIASPSSNFEYRTSVGAATSPRVFRRSVPTDSLSPSVASRPVIHYHTVERTNSAPNWSSLETELPHNSAQVGSTPIELDENDESVNQAVKTLQTMGFNQEPQLLRKLILQYKGDINKIIDTLGHTS